MFRPLDHLALSVASTVRPERWREREIHLVAKPLLARRASLAIHRFSLKHPEVSKRILGVGDDKMRRHGLELIGMGFSSIVVKSADHALKIIRSTADMGERERKELAEAKTREHVVLKSFLGDIVLSQAATVDAHPFKPRKRAVRITQPYVPELRPLNIFVYNRPVVDLESLHRVCARHPGVSETLVAVASSGLRMLSEVDMTVDTVGWGNFGITDTGRVVVVDGQPITSRNQRGLRLAHGHLTSLSDALGGGDRLR